MNHHKNRVFNTCLGFLRNVEDAEDVAQEVFIEVFDSIHTFRQESSLTTWIYQIAVHKSLELIRHRKRKKRFGFFQAKRIEDESESEESSDDESFVHPGIQVENKERAAVLFSKIAQLPENQRVAFTLHHVEGLSYKEIAGVMNLSLSAIESLLHRAKVNLKKYLFNYYQQNEID